MNKKIIKKYITKEVRGDGKIYYRINFVYNVKKLFGNYEKVIQDEILFENLEKATQYFNIVTKPSEDVNIIVEESSVNKYNLNLRHIYTIYDENIKKLVAIDNTTKNAIGEQYLFYYNITTINNIIFDGFIFSNDIIGELFSRNFLTNCWEFKNGNIGYYLYQLKDNAIYSELNKDFGNRNITKYIESKLSEILHYEYTFSNDLKLTDEQKRKRNIVVESEIIKTDDNSLVNQINLTDDYIKRNKLIEDELKRIDNYKNLLTSLIK